MGKAPRLDHYFKLICRFYEALYLLDILGRVRGPHNVARLDYTTMLAIRRRFLMNLAFMCDYMKGGLSSAAVAVEGRAECNVFWLATNEGVSDDTCKYLESVITAIKEIQELSGDRKTQAEAALTGKCVTFVWKRVKKQVQGLKSSIRMCQQIMAAQNVDKDGLGDWLRQFENPDMRDLAMVCQKAYDARNDPQMDVLVDLSRDGTSIPISTAQAFRKARHIIGRLAQHIRAVKDLIEDSRRLDGLLGVFEVAVVPRPSSVPRPQADDHTNLSGIMKRLLGGNDDERFAKCLVYLSDLNQHTGLEQELREQFDSSKTPPRVHAEIQMLHHFHDNRRVFAEGDPYIAASKPACLCCKLYFRHHPAGYAEPQSHEKIYPNWGPICLQKGRNDPSWLEHRRLMSKIIEDLRKEVLKELDRRQRTSLYREHPDSLTALTARSLTLEDESLDSQDANSDGDFDGCSEYESQPESDGGASL